MSSHEYYHKNPMLASHVAAAVFFSPLHNTQTEGGGYQNCMNQSRVTRQLDHCWLYTPLF